MQIKSDVKTSYISRISPNSIHARFSFIAIIEKKDPL